jgi:predicted dithiol-disulfide oxidoreductase (DUF899 family)
MKVPVNQNAIQQEAIQTKIVSRAEWIATRKTLLAREKELTRQRDALSLELRRLPRVKVEKEYIFESTQGRVTLRDLFGKQQQLLVYHFMFDPAWDEGCKSCSHLMDTVAGAAVHLAARNTALIVVSRAPISKIEPFRQRMGWNVSWCSSAGNDFNYDFHVTLDEALGSTEYNYADAAELVKARKLWSIKGELPGLSVFLRDGANIFHTYSAYQRGLDHFLNTYNLLDVTPLGRQEESDRSQSWIRHHDRYPA